VYRERVTAKLHPVAVFCPYRSYRVDFALFSFFW
jgi:hypothetical protein